MSIAYANFELHSVGVVSLRHDKVSRAKTAKNMMIKKCCDSYRVTTKVQRTPVQELCAEDGGGARTWGWAMCRDFTVYLLRSSNFLPF